MDTNLDQFSLPLPPQWSLNVGTAGKALVWVSVAFYVLAILGWLFAPKIKKLGKLGTISFQVANLSLIATFACLAALFLANRFEYHYVWEHSDNRNALQYRFAGIWSGQQGSFLLWATCSALIGMLTVRRTGIYKRWYVISYSVFLAMIVAILAFESPFELNTMAGRPFVPEDGFGLAPSLQNYWVTIHPPTIFLGFGSLTALFALAFSALVIRNFDDWVPIVRPLSLISLALVGLGLCMGGFWAYETLGWGGFWMWDPVENVSFVPWCFGIALVHGLVVQTAKKKWKLANLLLAGAPFLAFVYGTFLTRSGFLSDASVHSFAEMDSSALKLLVGVMGVAFVGFFGLWGVRLWQYRKETASTNERLTKDRWMSLGMWFLSLMGLATFVGMSVPLIMALRGQKPSVVQESLYHQVLPYIFVPLIALMAATPFLSWRKSEPGKVWGRVYTTVCISIGLTALMLFGAIATKYKDNINLSPNMTFLFKYQANGLPWMMFLVSLCMFAVVANVWHASQLWKRSKLGASGFIAHIGLALLMTGLIVSRGFELKGDAMLMKDHPAKVLGYEMKYSGMTSNDHDRENKLKIDVTDGSNHTLFQATPGLYKAVMGDGQESVMVWPHIQRGWLHDTYISLGQPQTQGTQDVKLEVGKSVTFGKLVFKYLGMKVNGQMGQPGTTFGAMVEVKTDTTTKTVEPKLQLGGPNGMKEIPAPLDSTMNLVMSSMGAADKSVSLRVDFTDPIYPIEVFHKPFTNLVFFGTALMTLAGLMSAWYRRAPRFLAEPAGENSDQMIESHPEKDLTLSGTKK